MKKAWVMLLSVLLCCSKVKKHVSHPHEIRVGNTIVNANMIKSDFPGNMNMTGEKEKKEGIVYFLIRMNRPGAERMEKEKSLYLDFDIQQDFLLLSHKDSIQAGFTQRVQSGVSDRYEFVVAFDTSNAKIRKPTTFIYKDQIFGIGTISFVF